MSPSPWRVLSVCLLAAWAGCGEGEATPQPGGPVFIAFSRDFAGFRSWKKFVLAGPEEARPPGDGGIEAGHTDAPRVLYANQLPPAGAKEFPVRTMLVKEIGEKTATKKPQIFAMVKRGGDYNAAGARNWAFFELEETADGVVTIRWSGVTPPMGELYGGTMGGSCNGCHGAAAANDFVLAPPLSLTAPR